MPGTTQEVCHPPQPPALHHSYRTNENKTKYPRDLGTNIVLAIESECAEAPLRGNLVMRGM